MATYRNRWHRPGKPEYGPTNYTTDARPTAYCGALIYERIHGKVWDVVHDGECLTQRAGLNGAKWYLDTLLVSLD